MGENKKSGRLSMKEEGAKALSKTRGRDAPINWETTRKLGVAGRG